MPIDFANHLLKLSSPCKQPATSYNKNRVLDESDIKEFTSCAAFWKRNPKHFFDCIYL